jgi:hypothetical protein
MRPALLPETANANRPLGNSVGIYSAFLEIFHYNLSLITKGNVMNTSRLAATAMAAMLVNVAATQASTFQFPELQRVEALRAKLQTATLDVTQAMGHASAMNDDFRCLDMLHGEAQFTEMLAAIVVDFMALSILMKYSEDETRTLSAMQPWVTRLSGQLPHSRETINGTMSLCSNSATVNVKGQNLLTILSEWSDPVAAISKSVARALKHDH